MKLVSILVSFVLILIYSAIIIRDMNGNVNIRMQISLTFYEIIETKLNPSFSYDFQGKNSEIMKKENVKVEIETEKDPDPVDMNEPDYQPIQSQPLHSTNSINTEFEPPLVDNESPIESTLILQQSTPRLNVTQLIPKLRTAVQNYQQIVNFDYSAEDTNNLYKSSITFTKSGLPWFLPYDPDFSMVHTVNITEEYYKREDKKEHEVLYGYYTFAYLDGYIPHLYEERDVDIPLEFYQNLNHTDQLYHFQLKTQEPDGKGHLKTTFSAQKFNIHRNRHFSFYSLPKYDKEKGLFDPYEMVFIIKTTIARIQYRTVIRHSYGNTSRIDGLYGPVKIFFLVGLTNNEQTNRMALEEQNYFNDMIIANIFDSYQNLTLKTMLVEDLFVAMKAKTPYYVTADDDACIDVLKLFKILKPLPKQRLAVGRLIHGTGTKGELKTMHVTPIEAIPHRIVAHMGLLTVYSNDIMDCQVRMFRTVDHLSHIDDIQRGYLLEKCHIKPLGKQAIHGTTNELARNNWNTKISPYVATHGVHNKIEYYGSCLGIY